MGMPHWVPVEVGLHASPTPQSESAMQRRAKPPAAASFVSVAGPSLTIVVAAIALGAWTGPARVARAEILSLREREFVQAAEVIGVPTRAILFREILPNLLPILFVQATFIFAYALLTESALSFLGAGVPPSTPTRPRAPRSRRTGSAGTSR